MIEAKLNFEPLLRWLSGVADKLPRNNAEALRRTGEAAATYARLSRLYNSHTYRLRNSIKPKHDLTRTTVTADAPYAFYVENGTKAHEITPRRKKMLRFEQNGEIRFEFRVWHPGTAPRPFMAEAQEKTTPLFSRLVAEAATDALS